MRDHLVITFQYFEGCPNSVTTLENLSGAVSLLKLSGSQIEVIEVSDLALAETLHFQGSPSILINGEDLITGLVPTGFSYSCRIYPFDPVQPGVIPKAVIFQRLQQATDSPKP